MRVRFYVYVNTVVTGNVANGSDIRTFIFLTTLPAQITKSVRIARNQTCEMFAPCVS